MRLPIPPIQAFSFFIGFIAGVILTFLLSRVRPLLEQIRTSLKENREAAKARGASSIEESHRRQVLKQAQGQHLAASLFSLDEILQPIRLLAPPVLLAPEESVVLEDIVTQTVPYMPDWPEMAVAYNAPTLTLQEALNGGKNLLLVGQPGSGKTVALAHLASLTANRDDSLGELSDYVPFLVHFADLELPLKNPHDLLAPIVEMVAERASMLNLARLPGFIEYSFKSGRALLLFDGMDELHREGIHEAVSYIELVLKSYPGTRVVATVSPEYAGGLVELGFASLAMMGWNAQQQSAFIETWNQLWEQTAAMEAWTQSGPQPVDSILLNEWLAMDNSGFSPLELTLKVWGTYAGDVRGPHPADAIDTHIRRLSGDVPLEATQILAMQVDVTTQPVFDPRKARAWVKSFEPEETPIEASPESTENNESDSETIPEESDVKASKSKKDKKGRAKADVPPPTSGVLAKLATNGLLVSHRSNRMRFAHPSFTGCLAGRALATYGPSSLMSQPAWSGKNLALYYGAIYGNATPQVQTMLNNSKPPLQQELLTTARWLREAPQQAPWKGTVFSALVKVIQNEMLPMSLRGKAIVAMVLSGDPAINVLFRQLLQTATSPSVLLLTALGAGMNRDAKAVALITSLLQNLNPTVQHAAILALVAIDSHEAMDVAASSLLNGDEDMRRAAAEALANNSTEGYEMLREGAEMDDILVRRSVVFGLGRVYQPWAEKRIQTMQVEDEQWVVRTAATEVVDSRKGLNPRVPRTLPPAHESPMMIQFAAKQGMGISPGQNPTDLLLLALKSPEPEEQLAALAYLRQYPSAGVVGALYNIMYSSDVYMREHALHTIQEMALDGIKLPDPMEFGLG